MTCLISQIERSFRLLRPDAPNEEIIDVQKIAMINLAKISQKSMPYYGQSIYRTLNNHFNLQDPYHELKTYYNQKASQLVPKLQKIIESNTDSLLYAVLVSILGNTIDFGTPHTINLEQELENCSIENLAINNYPDFEKSLTSSHTILIIGDNCGECIFDKVFIEYITHHFPSKKIFYAVRGGPVINDCTKDDLRGFDFEANCTIITTSASPGVIFKQSSEEFQEIFNTADLVISKGQGNFEALDDRYPEKGDMYFLLKAKCNFIANYLQVPLGSFILLKQDNLNKLKKD